MKFINRYIAFVAIVTLLLTSCSKDETNPILSDDPNVTSVDLTFGASLNDLVNRAASVNKDHFNDIPECSEAPPAIAVLKISYEGQPAEDVGDDIVVDILQDDDGYFTDYSEDLKIPVPNNSSVEVSLDSFKVYDGVVTDSKPYGELIWIAPMESEEGEFDGYVENALPFSFDVEDGTKPYIDVEVLCFDRRMVNEYGYVFFDILPEVIYPLCLFVNYCDENGRHFVADYSVDLYFGTDDTGIQLYDHTEQNAMATTGTNSAGNYFADPLCLVVPGPPANLDDDEPYLYLIIYPQDWAGTGNIDNTPVPVLLTWETVEELLNSDETTNEYLHLLIGECEDALEGDETIGGGNGNGEECENDFDGDGLCDEVDPDIDNDGILNENDLCDFEVPTTDANNDGCQDEDDGNGDECEADWDEDGICDDVDTDVPCTKASTSDDETIDVSAQGPPPPSVLLGEVGDGIVIITNTSTADIYLVQIKLDDNFTTSDNIEEYYFKLTQGTTTLEVGPVDVDTDEVEFEVDLSDFDTSIDIDIDAYIIYCAQ